jgi:hypothetical protein
MNISSTIYPAMMRSIQRKRTKKNSTHIFQNIYYLDVARSTVRKNHPLDVCWTISVLLMIMESYWFHMFSYFIMCHVKSDAKLYGIFSKFIMWSVSCKIRLHLCFLGGGGGRKRWALLWGMLDTLAGLTNQLQGRIPPREEPWVISFLWSYF